MNMSFLTIFVSFLFILFGLFLPISWDYLFSIGIFSLSGSITNWLAIHMLFEKVPFLYGSGVIPNRFKAFRDGIKMLMMEQFFTTQNIRSFFIHSTHDNKVSDQHGALESVVQALDYQKIFDGLVDVVLQSPLGGMLGMIGGKDALSSMQEPFQKKFKSILLEMIQEGQFTQLFLQSYSQDMENKIRTQLEDMIDHRLSELTPIMIKNIIKNMIHNHLGCLVVWGGFFGGLIGLITSLVKN